MTYQIIHTTTYDYSELVSLSHHMLRLHPRGSPGQRCLEHRLEIVPEPTLAGRHTDYFGNAVTFITIEAPHKQLTIQSRSLVAVDAVTWPDPADTPAWESVRDSCRGKQIGTALEASEFRFDSPRIRGHPDYSSYAGRSFTPARPVLEAVLDLNERIHYDFKFDADATTVATPVEEVFKSRRGVCQDFAQFEIACLRSLGLPARYVSGYLETVPPPGRVRLVGADASHAWVSFYCHGIGWVDVDPTNNLLPSSRHVTVAWGRDYSDVSPIRGVMAGGREHSLEVAVDVLPIQ